MKTFKEKVLVKSKSPHNFRSLVDPALHSAGHILHIAVRRTSTIAHVVGNVARVVVSCSLVEVAVVVDTLDQTIASRSSLRAVNDHLVDGVAWARGRDTVACSSLVGLHEAGVADAIVRVGGTDTWVTVGLLHNDRQDESVVDERRGGNGLDVIVDPADFLIRSSIVGHAEALVNFREDYQECE